MAPDQKKRHVVSYENMSEALAAAFNFKAISMVVQSIFSHLIIKVGVNHHKSKSKISKMRK